MEKVDILLPPRFEKSGEVKEREQAIADGDWLGTFNLWVVQRKPVPAIVYQQRGPNKSWAPNKLDVTVGGRLQAGEAPKQGMRESKEEIGKTYPMSNVKFVGRKLNVSPDTKGRVQHTVVHVFMIEDNSHLESYKQDPDEVYALCVCPIHELLKVHTKKNYSFKAQAILASGKKKTTKITKQSFPYNWDDYHFKIALLAEKFLAGEKNIVY